MEINLYSLLIRGGSPEEITAVQLADNSKVHVRYFFDNSLGSTEGIDLAELLQAYHELQKEVECERKYRQIAEEALIKLAGAKQ